MYCVERGEPVREGGQRAAECGWGTCWHVREGFLSGARCGLVVSVINFCTDDSRPGKKYGKGSGGVGIGGWVVMTYVVWSLFACTGGVVQT